MKMKKKTYIVLERRPPREEDGPHEWVYVVRAVVGLVELGIVIAGTGTVLGIRFYDPNLRTHNENLVPCRPSRMAFPVRFEPE